MARTIDLRVENLSDEFQSTFCFVREGCLSNMLHEDELPQVANLVKKHMGATEVLFHKMDGFEGEKYAAWLVVYK